VREARQSPELSRRFVSVDRLVFTKVSGGNKSMRQYNRFSGIGSLEMLELKLSPASFSVGTLAVAAVSPLHPETQADGKSDPLPNPEPPPGPDPGDNPPIVYPILPPSGPSGPGS
jgi:hypothetical protein